MRRFAFLFAVCAAVCFAQATKPDACAPPPGSIAPSLPAKLWPGQGGVRFPITTKSAEAQAFFDQGVSQMHSFWANEAERSFLQAAALDPEAAMPWWGVAMVAAGDYRPGFQLGFINGLPEKPRRVPANPRAGVKRAVEAARKASELSQAAGKTTEIERLYIAAVAARRDPDSENVEEGYVRALRAMIERYPREIEARSYLALHIMSGFTTPEKEPRAGSMEAVAILRDLLERAPEHPGVHHYVIHGWEGSTFAKDAWPSSDRYGGLAPGIAHALHMPGHIYAQTGRWADAAEAFAKAAENEVVWMESDRLNGNRHHGHNVHFMATVQSFGGDYEGAMRSARSLLEYKETPRELNEIDNYRTAWRQGWFAVLRTLVQHERWDEILDDATLPHYDRPRENAWRHWARALAYAAKGDRRAAKGESRRMEAALSDYKKKLKNDAPAYLWVARDELKAQLELAGGKVNRGLKGLEAAAERELALRYNEPPMYPRPVLEVLGAAALRHGRHEVAERAFRRALEQYPESAGALRGLRGQTASHAGE
jgi:tetratricopeptide (TPR) repeat protein